MCVIGGQVQEKWPTNERPRVLYGPDADANAFECECDRVLVLDRPALEPTPGGASSSKPSPSSLSSTYRRKPRSGSIRSARQSGSLYRHALNPAGEEARKAVVRRGPPAEDRQQPTTRSHRQGNGSSLP
jgi:hypothetical protein